MKNRPVFHQIFPQGEPLPEEFSRYFIGRAYLAPLTRNGALHVPVSNVTFEPGCRNNWHSHTGGQILVCTAGRVPRRGPAAGGAVCGGARPGRVVTDGLIARFREGRHSLVAAKEGDIRVFDGRGIADLYMLLKRDPDFLRGAEIADKVVGKGAAALMAAGGVREVFAEVASTPALRLLREAGIRVRYGREVPHIANRRGDGICPVEELCSTCATASECLPRIETFMERSCTPIR